MLGDDAQSVKPAELRGQRFLESDDDGVVVDDVGALEIELVEPARDLHRFARRIDDLLEREEDVGSADRRAVREGGFRRKMERVVLAVRRDFPLLRKAGDGIERRVELHERLE